ncbi:MAG: hypothetical protein [Bacteriophage sp.]|nr:MAG: hypothetical protein [Bacteriophage sp.]
MSQLTFALVSLKRSALMSFGGCGFLYARHGTVTVLEAFDVPLPKPPVTLIWPVKVWL